MYNGRFITENILEDDFANLFSPIHKLQWILGASRVDMRDNIVTTVSQPQKKYTLLWISCVTFSFLMWQWSYYTKFIDIFGVYLPLAIALLVQYISSVANMIHARYVNGAKHVKLYGLIQKLARRLKSVDFRVFDMMLYYFICFFVIGSCVGYACGFTLYVLEMTYYPLSTIFIPFGILTVQLDILLAGILIFYLSIRLKMLNDIIRFNIFLKYESSFGYSSLFIENVLFVKSSNGYTELDMMEMVICIQEILKAFNMIIDLFKFSVFITTATLCLFPFLAVEGLVFAYGKELLPTTITVMVVLMILCYFLQMCLLGVVCDWFTEEKKRCKILCLRILSLKADQDDWARKRVKAIVNVIESAETSFDVCGLFKVDKELSLTLTGLITGKLIVMIQLTVDEFKK